MASSGFLFQVVRCPWKEQQNLQQRATCSNLGTRGIQTLFGRTST